MTQEQITPENVNEIRGIVAKLRDELIKKEMEANLLRFQMFAYSMALLQAGMEVEEACKL